MTKSSSQRLFKRIDRAHKLDGRDKVRVLEQVVAVGRREGQLRPVLTALMTLAVEYGALGETSFEEKARTEVSRLGPLVMPQVWAGQRLARLCEEQASQRELSLCRELKRAAKRKSPRRRLNAFKRVRRRARRDPAQPAHELVANLYLLGECARAGNRVEFESTRTEISKLEALPLVRGRFKRAASPDVEKIAAELNLSAHSRLKT